MLIKQNSMCVHNYNFQFFQKKKKRNPKNNILKTIIYLSLSSLSLTALVAINMSFFSFLFKKQKKKPGRDIFNGMQLTLPILI